jgi:phospholipid/cholesterol/gamma-HCH transport system permease protein
MAPRTLTLSVLSVLDRIGRGAMRGIEDIGYCGVLVGESLFWLVYGPFLKQPVRLEAVVGRMMEVGVNAIPIIAVLSAAIGAVLAMQGIISLRPLGAESRVIFGIAKGVVREFAPLITGILIAGRSGSALAARIGTMKINQEIDALDVMGIRPERFLVAPALVAMVVMVPTLTLFSGLIGILAGGLYVGIDLGISLQAYIFDVLEALTVGDVLHGFSKSIGFGILIAVIGVMNGARVEGGAEGVGRATTRAVVQAISAIIVTDMLFVLVASLMR